MCNYFQTHTCTHTHIHTHTSLAVSGHYICQVGALNCAIFKKEKHHHYTHWLRYWFSSLYNLQKKKKNSLYKAKEHAPFFLDKKKVFLCAGMCVSSSSLLSPSLFFSSPSFLHILVPNPPFILPPLFLPFCQILSDSFEKKKPLHTLAELFLGTVMMSSLSRSVLCNFKKKKKKKHTQKHAQDTDELSSLPFNVRFTIRIDNLLV